MTDGAGGEFVTLASYGQAWQAQLAQAALQSEGIESMLVGEHHAALNWLLTAALGGVLLRVREADAVRAARVLGLAGRAEDS